MKLNLFRFILAVLLVLISVSSWAQSSVWMVKSGNTTVYLAGSMHILRASDHPFPAEFFRAYENSSQIIFETLTGEMEKPENMEKFMRVSVYSDGTTLRDHISPEAYARAESFCKVNNYPMNRFIYLRPIFFLMTLTVLQTNKLGADAKRGVDAFFKEKALNDGKMITGLETVEQQINFLTSLDSAMEESQILKSIDELKQIETLFLNAVNAWRKGDEKLIAKSYPERMKDFSQAYKSIITNRNKQWLKTIEKCLKEPGNTMLIVGLAHLPGEEGIINLLRKSGYEVVKLQNR
jgi:hypothetical protein